MKKIFKGLEFVCGSAKDLMRATVPTFGELLICAGCINANYLGGTLLMNMEDIDTYRELRKRLGKQHTRKPWEKVLELED